MSLLDIASVAAYVFDAAVLATYALVASYTWIETHPHNRAAAWVRKYTRSTVSHWFNWANAVGCVPLIYVEVVTGAWPALPLTLAFGLIGAFGVVTHRSAVRRMEAMVASFPSDPIGGPHEELKW